MSKNEFSHGDILKSKGPQKKKKKNEESSDDCSAAESSEEELDLTKECHPIAHYMDNRAEMIDQMFSVIKGNKLRSMLPPILKDMDIEQLKLACLDELLGISEKRIIAILDGEVLDTSSESEVLSADGESDKSSRKSSALDSEESERGSSGESNKRVKRKRKAEKGNGGKVSKAPRTKEEPAPEHGKTLLEILELEMRARAIRALLNQGSADANAERGGSGENQQASEVVDLTEGDDEEFPSIIKKETETTEQEASFENKVLKTVKKANKNDEGVKKQKIIADLEMRNKLIKKKSYRTRQQRMENEEMDDIQKNSGKEKDELDLSDIRIKEELPGEVLIEDAEEGEVSSEEEASDLVIKQEKPESPEKIHEEAEKTMTGERITAIDDGNFVVNANLEYNEKNKDGDDEGDEVEEVPLSSESKIIEDVVLDDETKNEQEDNTEENIKSNTLDSDNSQPGPEELELEDTSWRGRWLMRDEVKKLVKSSKICAKAKKNFAKKKAMVKNIVPSVDVLETDSNSMPPTIEGKVSEYKTLVKTVADRETIRTPQEMNDQISVPSDCNETNDLAESTEDEKGA